MKNKPSFHTAALAGLLAFTIAASGQQPVSGAGGGENQGHLDRMLRGGFPEVQAHMKGLAEKLGLADEQSARIKPILVELHDMVQKVVQDQSLSGEENHARLKGAFERADRKMREFLDENQKQKLDELEREMHSQLGAGPAAAHVVQGASGANQSGLGESRGGVSKVDQHLKLLAGKLGLSVEQQGKVKPILQEMNDASDKILQGGGLAKEDLLSHMKAYRERADRKIRQLLDDGQKLKLDDMERAPHPELHGELKGNGGSSPVRPNL